MITYSQLMNNIRMLKPDGRLYISFPIGKKNELILERFDYVDDFGNLHQNISLDKTNVNVTYGCGIYTFKKNKILSNNL